MLWASIPFVIQELVWLLSGIVGLLIFIEAAEQIYRHFSRPRHGRFRLPKDL